MIQAMFTCSVCLELGDGASARFWTDAWLPAGQIKFFAPHLFRAIGRRFLNVSVKDAIFQHRWVRHITGSHTAPVLYEYVELREKLESVQLRPLEGDQLALDSGWCVLSLVSISLVLPGHVFAAGG